MFKFSVLRKSFVCLSLGIIVLTLLACSNTSSNTSPGTTRSTNTHKTYNYAHVAFPINTIFQPGQQLYTLKSKNNLELVWTPHPGQSTTDTQPLSVTINGTLIGPFASSDTLKKAIQNSDFTHKPVVASFAPMQTTSWVDKTYTSTMMLPPTIAPGYYILLQTITLSGQNQHVVGKASMEIEVPST